MNPENQVTLITGAVGNLGFATAWTFQSGGTQSVLVDRSPNRLSEVFKGTVDSPDHLLAGGVDLADTLSLSKLIERLDIRHVASDGIACRGIESNEDQIEQHHARHN